MTLRSTAPRSTTRAALPFAIALSLVAAACGGDDGGNDSVSTQQPTATDKPTAKAPPTDTEPPDRPGGTESSADTEPPPDTEPGAATEAPATTIANTSRWNGVNIGPDATQLDSLLAEIGTVEPGVTSDATSCAGLPYMSSDLVVYLSPGAHDAGVQVEITNVLKDALDANGLTLADDLVGLDNLFTTDDVAVLGLGGPVFVLSTKGIPSVSNVQQVQAALLDVFGGEVAVDVNHIGPFLPIGTFHPGSDPEEASQPEDAPASNQGTHSVLVIDSPPADEPELTPEVVTVTTGVQTADYDAWGEDWDTNLGNATADEKVDFVAGHGPFVYDLIKKAAPTATVTLSPVVHGDGWPGYLFTEVDVIAALENGLGATAENPRQFTVHYDLINFSLGLFGCDADRHPVLAGELNDILNPTTYSGEAQDAAEVATVFVAAAGNDGSGRAHYPAAFADTSTTSSPLSDQMIAVGALPAPDATQRVCWSNFADWVTAWAPGTAIAAFPPAWSNATGLAKWSGTSFATARVTGALADSLADVMGSWTDAKTSGPVIGASSARYSTAIGTDSDCADI